MRRFSLAPVFDSLSEPISKIVDRDSGQGVGWRKSGAYTAVCEHFEPSRNAALDPESHFCDWF
jgi:hypothetical protein